MIIAVCSSKGGTGKTTTVATLARLRARQRPVILDTDLIQSISSFKLKGVKVVDCEPECVTLCLARVKSPMILIDCRPGVAVNSEAIRAADLVILPTSPEPLELAATLEMLPELEGRPARILFNRYSATYRRYANAASRELGEQVFTTRINRNTAVALAAGQGLTILDTAPDSVPARQYKELGDEINQWQKHYST